MIIPLEELSDEAINNLVAEYCLRDWGLNEDTAPFENRTLAVKKALQDGLLKVLYSELHETASLVPSDQLLDMGSEE